MELRGRLGQLIVTPEIVASKINNMKDKSPGVDGIAPKTLKTTVELISMPLGAFRFGA